MRKDDQSYKNYLNPSTVSKLKSLELKARMVVEGFMVGLHKSPYHGFSAEFSEHRSYQQGDSLKNIDWNVYAKSEKFFIKRYEEETNLISHVLLDVSKSMDFKKDGEVTKLEYGAILASSMLYIMQQQQDAAGLTLYSDKIEDYYPPKASRVYSRNLQKALATIKSSNKTNTASCLSSIVHKIKKRGLVIIISDFFDDLDSVLSAIKSFHYKKNEVILFQILDPIEQSFAYGKDAVFVDLESGEEITTQPYQIQKSYQETMKKFLHKLKSESLNYGIEYNLINTSTPFDKALFSYFKKRKRLN